MSSATELWEILVPATANKGFELDASVHEAWDHQVRQISGGLTIMPSAKGQWVLPNGDVFHEKMIPVRIACNEQQMHEIIDFTLDYYEQDAVMAYKISDKCIIKRK